MLIFDAHLDMAWNACEWNRNYMLSVQELREYERQFENLVPGDCTTTWPELKNGKITTIIATLLPRLNEKISERSFFQSREAAYAASYGQLAYYKAMINRGVIRQIHNCEELDSHLAEWEAAEKSGEENPDLPIGFILSMEGSWSVLSPGMISEWYEQGLRLLGPAHYGPDYYCHGTGSEGGLKEEGPALIKAMDDVGMILDVTHLSDQSFYEALEIYTGPVIASHHNCRALVPGDRQLTDEQIKLLIERDVVIGAVFDCWMNKPGWVRGVEGKSNPEDVSLEDVVNHIDHICQLAGTTKHCGIGSDLDGGFGKEQTPHDLDTIADLQKLTGILDRRGYSQEDIEGIMYKNYINFFRRAWS
jgi:membrane dipeptidase